MTKSAVQEPSPASTSDTVFEPFGGGSVWDAQAADRRNPRINMIESERRHLVFADMLCIEYDIESVEYEPEFVGSDPESKTAGPTPHCRYRFRLPRFVAAEGTGIYNFGNCHLVHAHGLFR
jgi:hypothetical protein